MVKPKKHLGQHFLKDTDIAHDIVKAVKKQQKGMKILEIGPGTGVLTQFLVKEYPDDLVLIDLDKESINYLEKHYSEIKENIIYGDFLRLDLSERLGEKYVIIGNFPYNISSQIFFKVLEDKEKVVEVVGMLQKEVAERLASPPGNKNYGILSVLLQAFYDIEYLFTVGREVFDPPPKVQSGVIRLVRNERQTLDCDEDLFKRVVKQGFQNRRKTLRNALKPLNLTDEVKQLPVLNKRAEELSVKEFEELTNTVASGRINEV
ncbi:16S rRNA (adenine(1518)-N(6)/adenine(1519)-N(6))-dimethyltransferase RsmA [Fulvivirga maritima]|uniref:16S rRNA (adenine(1518)-N(6)/adenine(1519)-N(6))- dimethyltransferase RsmA n=1 Tax=Fulvivirga maritima TaxID=2904247 RepID=UPI001F3A54F6|nr:16S rRNA (adenine(1518)-N(6)/adenine(1519)-N(6))-dimethyltransferase RsmA [Fulvivirga maritima]UII29390.1 16S rRNA (adenine(1518)-N(6)/adenine(1519)-N(6))-dimethyltransferase RsmA [Fulvivirga maritima]